MTKTQKIKSEAGSNTAKAYYNTGMPLVELRSHVNDYDDIHWQLGFINELWSLEYYEDINES